MKSKSSSGRWLTSSEINQIKAKHLREAVYLLLDGKVEHAFSDSTHYDVLLNDGTRIPPKALFGVAASRVLNFEVLPSHFTGGEGTPCFRTIRNAGFCIVPKDSSRN